MDQHPEALWLARLPGPGLEASGQRFQDCSHPYRRRLRRQALPLSRTVRGVAGGALRPAGADDPDPRRGNGVSSVAPSLQGGVQDGRQKRRDPDGPADPHPVQHRRLRRLRPQHGGSGVPDGDRPLPLPECGPHGKRHLHQHGAKRLHTLPVGTANGFRGGDPP